MTELGAKLPAYRPSAYDIYDKIKDKQEVVGDQSENLNPTERKLIQDLKIVESVAMELNQLDAEGKHGEEAFKRYKILMVAKSKLEELVNDSSGYSMLFREKLFGVNGKVNKILARCKFLDKKPANPVPFMQKEPTAIKNPFDDDESDNSCKKGRFNPFDDFSTGPKDKLNQKTDVKFIKKAKIDEKDDGLRNLDFGLRQTGYDREQDVIKTQQKNNLGFDDFLSDLPVKPYDKSNMVSKGNTNTKKNELFDIDPSKPNGNFDVDLI